MLLGNINPSAIPEGHCKPDGRLVFGLILTGRYAEAYTLLTGGGDKLNDPGLLYNLSLCLFYAERYREAIIRLDEANRKMESGLKYSSLPVDVVHNVLREKQCETDCYRQPLPEGYADRFAGLFKDSIIRLKVDCYVNMEEWDSVLSLGITIQGKHYANITRAIVLAKSKNKML